MLVQDYLFVHKKHSVFFPIFFLVQKLTAYQMQQITLQNLLVSTLTTGPRTMKIL